MKKNKFLIPVAAITAVAGIVAPIVTLTSCGKEKKPDINISDVLDIDGLGVLHGFKDGITNEDIEGLFGDTLTIPKTVTSIARYAFYDRNKSTIPSFIKHLKFEDEYKCEIIEEYAFAYNPFETIEFTNERNHPTTESDPSLPESWSRVSGGWGLKCLVSHAFYSSKNLTKITMCASIKEFRLLPGERKEDLGFLFGWDEDYGIAKVNVTNINLVDASDFVITFGDDQDSFDNLMNSLQYIVGFGSELSGQRQIFNPEKPGKLILRSYDDDSIYGPRGNRDDAKGFNIVREAGGLAPIGGPQIPDHQYVFTCVNNDETQPIWSIEYTHNSYLG